MTMHFPFRYQLRIPGELATFSFAEIRGYLEIEWNGFETDWTIADVWVTGLDGSPHHLRTRSVRLPEDGPVLGALNEQIMIWALNTRRAEIDRAWAAHTLSGRTPRLVRPDAQA